MFEVQFREKNSKARLGKIETPHGLVETPAYVIVGTHAEVRCLSPSDLPRTKTQLIIANTYHLWQQLGDEGLESYAGLHAEMGWPGPIMTDSGGFQVFSLGFLLEQGLRRGQGRNANLRRKREEPANKPRSSLVRITPAGVYFKSSEEGAEESYLDAEISIKVQEQLGADIIVAFDEPTAPLADQAYVRAAMERTHAWAERSLEAKESRQALYGVVQGGGFEDLRAASAKTIGAMPFDGYAIGSTYGEAYGGTRAETGKMLDWSVPHLPEHKPRHLFGVGRIEDIFLGVEKGIDTFDCVIPTREARHGGIWTASGRFDIKKGAHRADEAVLDPACDCPVCGEMVLSREELHQLFKSKNPEAGRLATIHNVFFFNNLMIEIRQAIKAGSFDALKEEYLQRLVKIA